jgi:hypothetical protein
LKIFKDREITEEIWRVEFDDHGDAAGGKEKKEPYIVTQKTMEGGSSACNIQKNLPMHNEDTEGKQC